MSFLFDFRCFHMASKRFPCDVVWFLYGSLWLHVVLLWLRVASMWFHEVSVLFDVASVWFHEVPM